MKEAELLLVLGGLLVYMFFTLNFVLILVEKRIPVSEPKLAVKVIVDIVNAKKNPDGYLKARTYFWGSVISLILFMMVLYAH
ncbi:hypothetical protein K0504_06235 [Neiella marina]|uniref:Uncharacterized protein n=1 Tax=Neiella holothuriorum TaxID=2870530 RepID=A0ABS7EFR4_9GAMM|nr:hypothetical protein [Neiella holothuriorum]MBW8190631.1 hypothetical protein [Neiella holothuriorum]